MFKFVRWQVTFFVLNANVEFWEKLIFLFVTVRAPLKLMKDILNNRLKKNIFVDVVVVVVVVVLSVKLFVITF